MKKTFWNVVPVLLDFAAAIYYLGRFYFTRL